MRTNKRAILPAILLLSAAATRLSSQSVSPPRLFFTDIVTGANKGGENNNGVYLTIYGKGFGATQGNSTVTIGGGAPAQYKIWGQNNSVNTMLDMIVVQTGPKAATGNIIVTVNGNASNPLPFTVSSGHIYFVSPNGNDSNNGSFASPWLTPVNAKSMMVAGDTVYFRAGTYTTIDDFGSVLLCNKGYCSGTPSQYQNFLGYPGETATLGSSSTVRGIYHWADTVWQYATVAELTVVGQDYSLTCQNVYPGGACNYLRIVGNNLHCTDSCTGLDLEMPADHIAIYGNESAQNCLGNPNCNYNNRAYSFYFGGYGAQSNFDVGWNRLHDNPFGKGIQVYGHVAGDTITHLVIHDNEIYNNTMTGIELGGSDGNTDFVQDAFLYNNILWNNANGAPVSHMVFGGVELQGLDANDGTYTLYNNTFYANSPAHNGIQAGGAIAFGTNGVRSVSLTNNIFYGAPGSPCYLYFDDSSAPAASRVLFSNNLYFAAGSGPSGCNYNVGSINVGSDAKGVNANPNFANPSASNFHLTAGSPAIDAGIDTGITTDFDGVARPQGSAFDIGAFEFVSGSGARLPPPINVSVVVR
jgi:trimeric autotransporter adhesin